MSIFQYRKLTSQTALASWQTFPFINGNVATLYDYTESGHNIVSSPTLLADEPWFSNGNGDYAGPVGFISGTTPARLSFDIGAMLPNADTSGFSVQFGNVMEGIHEFTMSNSGNSHYLGFAVDTVGKRVIVKSNNGSPSVHVFQGLYDAILASDNLRVWLSGLPLTFSASPLQSGTATVKAFFNNVEYSIPNVSVHHTVGSYSHIALYSESGSISVFGEQKTLESHNDDQDILKDSGGTIYDQTFDDSVIPEDQAGDELNGYIGYDEDDIKGEIVTLPDGGTIDTVSESMSFSDSIGLSEEALRTIGESLRFRSASVFESNLFKAYSVNKRTGAASRYDGFFFDSFDSIGGKLYGLRGDGLYEIGGEADEEFPIESVVSTGMVKFRGEGQKRLVSAYISGEFEGESSLNVVSDRDEYWKYRIDETSGEYKNTRVKLGKGLSGFAYRFEIVSDGNIDVDSINIDALYKSRRV
jgi:hypothetical protein